MHSKRNPNNCKPRKIWDPFKAMSNSSALVLYTGIPWWTYWTFNLVGEDPLHWHCCTLYSDQTIYFTDNQPNWLDKYYRERRGEGWKPSHSGDGTDLRKKLETDSKRWLCLHKIFFTHLVRALEQSSHTKCRNVLHIIFLGKVVRLTKQETLYSTHKKPY